MGMNPLRPSPRQERDAQRRSAARAAEVASALGLVADRDPEVPTTYHLRPTGDAPTMQLSMGSPAFPRGPFGTEYVDWMMIRAKGDPLLPEGARIRPLRRTVSDWREGAPGEAPTHITPRGTELVIEHGKDERVDVARALAWIDALPEGMWLVDLSREEVELRAQGAVVTSALEGARNLFDLVRF